MNFDIDEEQRNFAEHARDFFSEQAGPGTARRLLDEAGDPAPGPRVLAELGFSSLTIPEIAGGVGAELLNMALVAEQAGRQLAGPSLATAARVAVLLEGDEGRLRDVSEGRTVIAVVDGSPAGSSPSMDALSATHFLALDGEDLLLGEGRVSPGEPIDATRGLGFVELTSSEVVCRDARERWERARQVACVVLAAEGLGAADRVVELGIEHARSRETFGRPIGAYQAVKHRLVDDWVAVNQLRSLVWWAAWAADHAPEQLPLAASAAKAYCATTFETACETLIHVLGGIGFTWEHDAHLYWRRAKVDRLLLGDESEHLAAVALQSISAATRAVSGETGTTEVVPV
ncbi:acyl-CoA dehydrogenase family protein [Geodermatophilus sabuli]|uniref:Acyl-CoA dehydrogenase n=1 Tax=Geodermatophilus sabuli TaxID=1564158 RepID=A0A285EAD9_9ACTN|nr:acyl-CoA dehydrogenase family protein [Geodermatophilus sabuli]MBB3085536.1 alkylation response protein AidB-like acyl-CoA dehydrogenase [Geodermatophilus sabuli]SNX96042.1 Acyl-CoA dehydrogenase [Geodermatophilus sabuli]